MVAYLAAALRAASEGGAPLRVTLPMLEKIREGAPVMKELWEVSQLATTGRDADIRYLGCLEKQVRAGLADGTLTLDCNVLPDGIARQMME